MSCLSEPISINDNYNNHGTPKHKHPVPSPSCMVLSFFLLLPTLNSPQLFDPSSNIQESIWAQLYGCTLIRIQLQYKIQTEWIQMKSGAFVPYQWFPLILSLSHLEVRNDRINTRSSNKRVIRNLQFMQILFPTLGTYEGVLWLNESAFQNTTIFAEFGN